MARVDSDAVLRRFRTLVLEAEKPHFGEKEILRTLAELEAEETVPESILEKAARLFGVRTVLTYQPPESEGGPAAVSDRNGTSASSVQRTTEGGHDGREEGRERELTGGSQSG